MKIPKILYVLLIVICLLLIVNLWAMRYELKVVSGGIVLFDRWMNKAYLPGGREVEFDKHSNEIMDKIDFSKLPDQPGQNE